MSLHRTTADRLQAYRETKTLFPRTGFFGVLTLQGEKMLAEAVPGIAADSDEMQAVRALGTVQCIALCAQVSSDSRPQFVRGPCCLNDRLTAAHSARIYMYAIRHLCTL